MNNVLIKLQTLMIKVILSIYRLSIFYIGTGIPKLTYSVHNHTATTCNRMYFQGDIFTMPLLLMGCVHSVGVPDRRAKLTPEEKSLIFLSLAGE